MAITFKQIDAFRAVMLTGTTTEAAKMLGVSQPAISRLISDLELDIGYDLFDRVGRRVMPTREAKLLIEEVRKALIGLNQIRDSAIEIGQSRFARLQLVSVPAAASGIAIDLIELFAQRHPNTNVTLEVMTSDAALEWVVTQQCDLGIAAGVIESPSIATQAIRSGCAVCILPPGHRLSDVEQVTPEMLDGDVFVSFCRNSTFRQEIDGIFGEAGVSRNLLYEARTTEAICGFVARGLGVSIVGSLPMSSGLLSTGGAALMTKPFNPAPTLVFSLIWSTHRAMSATAKAFLQVIREPTVA